MVEYSSEFVNVIYQLLPGFISAWVFYALTSCLKPSVFERIIQALIMTSFVKALLILTVMILTLLGNYCSFGVLSKNIEFVYSIVIALLLGTFFSWCINNDFPLWLFRPHDKYKNSIFQWTIGRLANLNLTNKTLHPSEWFSFFQDSNAFAILHLDGERRLIGYLHQFPDSPTEGHFIVINAGWINDDNSITPLENVQKILISSKEVLRIELLKPNHNQQNGE